MAPEKADFKLPWGVIREGNVPPTAPKINTDSLSTFCGEFQSQQPFTSHG